MIHTIELQLGKLGPFVAPASKEALKSSLSSSGFAYLALPGGLRSLPANVLREGRIFLGEADDQAKSRVETIDGSQKRGFYRFSGTTDTGVQCFNIGREATHPEKFRQAYFESIDSPTELWMEASSRRNKWPNEYPKLRPACLDYFNFAHQAAMSVLSSIDLPSTFAHGNADSELEVKLYPGVSTGSEDRFRDHIDLTSVSLLIQDKTAGLEIFLEDFNQWVKVGMETKDTPHGRRFSSTYQVCVFLLCSNAMQATNCDEKILCIVGRFGQMMSIGQFRAGVHRVASAPNEGTRTSAVFFCTPDWHYQLPDGSQVGDHMPLQF
ncbi:hypothetical protein NDN08_007552 [Rhodosorus marinus]|uniref:Fe2OG dioxygenase domain-containing protein n=1 Tax=Rhodosorus marinus TaxID=101924 RepID=A0AAV8V0Q8_9RHOD|nr:hypothetical protein NDN08_007552 [Rhodosorus marinus]